VGRWHCLDQTTASTTHQRLLAGKRLYSCGHCDGCGAPLWALPVLRPVRQTGGRVTRPSEGRRPGEEPGGGRVAGSRPASEVGRPPARGWRSLEKEPRVLLAHFTPHRPPRLPPPTAAHCPLPQALPPQDTHPPGPDRPQLHPSHRLLHPGEGGRRKGWREGDGGLTSRPGPAIAQGREGE
jgi:hypothetical protein